MDTPMKNKCMISAQAAAREPLPELPKELHDKLVTPVEAQGQILNFDEILRAYQLTTRTLVAVFEKDDAITLRFDLYNNDDPIRCQEGMAYLLDVTVQRKQFRIDVGTTKLLHETFSGDILLAEPVDGVLCLVADCSFYSTKERDVIEITLTYNMVEIKEHPPATYV